MGLYLKCNSSEHGLFQKCKYTHFLNNIKMIKNVERESFLFETKRGQIKKEPLRLLFYQK